MSSKISKLLTLAVTFALCIPSALAAQAQKPKTSETKPTLLKLARPLLTRKKLFRC